jgi:hypothetical protein
MKQSLSITGRLIIFITIPIIIITVLQKYIYIMSRTCEVAFALEACPGWRIVRQNASRTENAIRAERGLQKQKRRKNASRKNRPIRQSRARIGGSFLLFGRRSSGFSVCGILQPYKPAQNAQKRRCDGADSRTRERVRENRNTMRRALKRE